MTAVAIAPERIKQIRTARKSGRVRLAKLTGLTERKLAALEQAGDATLEAKVLFNMAAALHVPVPTLTGELAIIDEDLQPISETRCTNGCCG